MPDIKTTTQSNLKDVLCVGEAMLELATRSPSAADLFKKAGQDFQTFTGQTFAHQTFMSGYGGDTFNTAVACARLGLQTTYLTRFADDAFASGLKAFLTHEGIASDCSVVLPDSQTGLYFVSIEPQSGQRQFVYRRKHSAASTLSADDISPELIEQHRIVYSSGITLALSESCRQAVRHAFRTAKTQGRLTVFDPNLRPALWPNPASCRDTLAELLPWVDILLPSFPEDTTYWLTEDLETEAPEPRDDCNTVIQKLRQLGLCRGVLKLGKKGAVVFLPTGNTVHVPTPSVQAMNTTGAGDAFNAAFMTGLLQGLSDLEAARFACMHASRQVQQAHTLYQP